MKRAAIVAGFILVLICACAFIFQRWARATLARLDVTSRAEVAAELARIGAAPRRPIIGAPRAADAAPEYIAALEDYSRVTVGGARAPGLMALAKAAPVPLNATTTAALSATRAAIDRAREATRCERCVWQPFAEPADPRNKVAFLVGDLGALLILDGHERVLAGDPAGAAKRYLEAIAFGLDFATDGTAFHLALGLRVAGAGADALARVPHDAAAAAALAGAVPSVVTATRIERLVAQRFFARVPGGSLSAAYGIGTVSLPERVLGGGFLALHAADLDELGRATEAAYAIGDSGARTARFNEIAADADSSWFPILGGHATGLYPELRSVEDELRAKLAAPGSGPK